MALDLGLLTLHYSPGPRMSNVSVALLPEIRGREPLLSLTLTF